MRVNLHSHLEGSIRPATAAELAVAAGVAGPAGGWAAALTMAGPADLSVFLSHVAAVYPLLGSPEALERVACEAVEDAAADGLDYLELRFGPTTHARRGFSVDAVIEAVGRGLAEGVRITGMPAGLVVCALRHDDDETNLQVARQAAQLAGAGVVGFDLAGDELLFPSLERYKTPFRIAAAAGLGLTAHVAEAGPGSNVMHAVHVLGTRRVGHGSRVADETELLAWAAGEAVCFEVCPTSNVLTGAAPSLRAHPVLRFLEHGCAVVLGDDDPVTTGSRFSREEQVLLHDVGIAEEQLEEIHRRSVDVAFCTDFDRAALRRRSGAGLPVEPRDAGW